ncbi:EAL domain-containing protein [Kineosporia sp. J2-2]|uniref:EAL domain-containing protein n=1 Tax=Kineosporia corallincola TaxID=2835133 RepID=A0ABS5TNH4_9ACTN|nr:EAL domain-containing protein [Kineosporia corallincola]MBT0772654.1 EAL domain-containing protein [Kineosporia corallincola]
MAHALTALGVLVVVLTGLVPLWLGRPAELAGLSTLPWWLFAIAFTVTDACGMTVGIRGRRYAITLGGIPLAAGLYLSDPGPLLLGRLLGGLLVAAWFRRQRLRALAGSAVAVIAGTTVAELLFRSLVLDHALLGHTGRAMTLVVVGASVLAESLLLLRVRPVPGPGPEAARLLGCVLVTGVIGAAIGLIPVLSVDRGEIVLPGVVLGPALVVGFRAFALLSERHARLSRLYELSDVLARTPEPARAVPLVLERSADLLNARYAELVLNDDLLVPWDRSRPGHRMWVLRAGEPVTGPRSAACAMFALPFPPAGPLLVRGTDATESAFLRERGIGQAALVPLRIGDRAVGHLVVGERGGGERGFTAPDLALLETVAGRAALALGNGHELERLQFEARHDELTGLPNRLDFRAQLDEAVEDLFTDGRQCAVMLLDFNGFKAINDTLGHHAGDALLRELAGRLRKVAGRGVTIARLGGDEFAVLAPGMGDGAARALARRLLSAFDEPVTVDGNELRVGGSLGVAVGPEQGDTGAELLRLADVAMYVAKAAGGGYRMFTRAMDLPTSRVQALGTALREALEAGRIGIAVQPLVDLADGEVYALEALARWQHPELGEVPPEEFFAAAERSGLVSELSRTVLDQALAGARDWLDTGRQVRVAINLAPGWLADPTLPDQITTALETHDVPADLLYLEFSEADVIDQPETGHGGLTALSRLRALGVRLSVDDFGTGYSSLTFLSKLPVDQIKIDRSYVQDLRSGIRGRAVVQSIIDVGRNLGLEVVAEGVADAHTRIELRRMGCEFGQGYYFDAPMAVEDLAWRDDAQAPRVAGFGPWRLAFPPSPRRTQQVLGPLDTLAECSSPTPTPPSVP